MIQLGGNIYYLSKLFSTDGKSFQFVAATMTGLTQEQYAEMMLNGGRHGRGQSQQVGVGEVGRPAFGGKK